MSCTLVVKLLFTIKSSKMKKLLFAISTILVALNSYSQEGPLDKGQVIINPGVGLGSYLGTKSETYKVPPLSVSVEYALSDQVTIGGIAGYYASKYVNRRLDLDYTYSHKVFGARLNYYYDIGKKLDLYGGAGLGYNVVGFKTSYDDNLFDDDLSTSGVFYTLHVGTRYHFSKRLGAFAELGYGFAILNFGLSLKL